MQNTCQLKPRELRNNEDVHHAVIALLKQYRAIHAAVLECGPPRTRTDIDFCEPDYEFIAPKLAALFASLGDVLCEAGYINENDSVFDALEKLEDWV